MATKKIASIKYNFPANPTQLFDLFAVLESPADLKKGKLTRGQIYSGIELREIKELWSYCHERAEQLRAPTIRTRVLEYEVENAG